MAISEDLDRLLDDTYRSDLSGREADELRSMRDECQAVEAKLSFLRRMVQGRLDIVNAELDRRASGAASGDLSDLVERLPQILADKGRAPGPGRLPTNLLPPEDEGLTDELDAISGPSALGSLPDLSDEALGGVATQLQDLERRVSRQRRAMFDVIDAVQAELASRFEQEAGT
jgi:hypothetical protein